MIPNNPKKKISTYVDQSIKVFHYKDPLIKKARYLQTDKILKKTLPTLSPKNYNYYRLLKFFAQNLIFLKKFNEAIEPLQKCLQNTTSNDDKACLLLEQLIFCYIQTKQLDKAIVVIDNFGTKHKQRFWLSYGDIYSLVDPTKSIKAYQKAIQIGPDSYDYNIERMLIHPHLMLAKIYLLTNQLDESKTHLDFCIQNSHNSNSILECKQIKTLIAKTI
ncbi:hypothetical protein HC766_01015 [Candidatus Gracilibacteria bacterium]|nr:hypothetical protein [Candidatus Gracilibacteria bacterium]